MGYQGVTGEAGKKVMIGATFEKIDGKVMTLGDIGVSDGFAEIADTLTILNEFGGAAGVYVYVTKVTADEFGLNPGWYDNYEIGDWDGESALTCYNNVELYDGEALMVQTSSDSGALVFAGSVALTETELECHPGEKTFLCNASPVDVKLGDITVNELFAEIADTLTILNEFGGAAGVYVYVPKATADEFGLTPGWYDNYEIGDWDGESALTCYNNIDIAAGHGFMLQTSAVGGAIVVPSAVK